MARPGLGLCQPLCAMAKPCPGPPMDPCPSSRKTPHQKTPHPLQKNSLNWCVFCATLWTYKKMRDVCTIIFTAVSRQDLCYVSEDKGFCFNNTFQNGRGHIERASVIVLAWSSMSKLKFPWLQPQPFYGLSHWLLVYRLGSFSLPFSPLWGLLACPWHPLWIHSARHWRLCLKSGGS